jgi:serine/threonine-protein kinase
MTDLVCENCSTPLPGGSKYCNECGTPVPGQGAARQPAYALPTDLRQALQMASAGEYEIHHELGRGGMGSVFLAREIGLDRLVAIKVLPPTLMFDEGLIMRFKREAKMVAKLHHPNIIPVYRVHHSHNLAFYTMHFVSGRALGEILSSSRTLSLEEVEKIMLDAAAGLGYAHKRGVIHRDVKPANILIDADGHVHLTDFGIAKALVGHTQLTETGAVIGTPTYMAPEQCEGRVVDGRADQYSLACVGYHLLAGYAPFESDSMKELIYHHLFTPPQPLSAVRPDVPNALRDAIHKGLSKDPADRFDCMEDFRAAIEGKGPPVFVRWIDGPEEERRGKAARKKFRRSTDMPTTRRLAESPWSSEQLHDESSRLSVYQRSLAALAVTIVSLAAVAVLAVSQGAGLAGSLRRDSEGGEGNESVAALSGAELSRPADRVGGDNGGSPMAQPPGELEASSRRGLAVISGELPPGAVLEVDGQEVEARLYDGAEIRLPLGSSQVVIRAEGYEPWRRDVFVSDDVLELSPSLERARAPTRTSAGPTRRAEPVREPSLDVIQQLRSLLDQATQLYLVQRYGEALETLEDCQAMASEALTQFKSSDSLAVITKEAEVLRLKTRKECELLNDPACR